VREARTARAYQAIDWLTERVLEALARADAVDPIALMLLLRRYGATDRADLADAFGLALARAIESRAFDDSRAPSERTDWLMLLSEASKMSEDERLPATAANLVSSLRQDWSHLQLVEPLASSIDACLTAAEILDPRGDPRELVPHAIDELERVISGAYRPGDGMASSVGERNVPRRLGDQVRSASALLTAFSSTGRLPYAMLAEELMQFARRTLWDDETGGFLDAPFLLNCEAARVLCRLAALHDAEEYRQRAVLAPGADHGLAAGRILAALEPLYRDEGVKGAIYGVALGEWLARP